MAVATTGKGRSRRLRPSSCGGYPNPVVWQVLLARELFDKRPQELDEDQNEAAVVRMCEPFREYRNAL